MNWMQIDYMNGIASIDIEAIDGVMINFEHCMTSYCPYDFEEIECRKCEYNGYSVNLLVQGINLFVKAFDDIEDAIKLRDSILHQIEAFRARNAVCKIDTEVS